MKQLHFLMMFIIILALAANGQVGINADGSQPDPSAMLDVKSGVKGLLPPRVALTAINVADPVIAPAVGLHVYNTATAGTSPNNVIPGNYYWNGTRWIPVSPPQGANFGDMLYWNGTQYVQVPVGLPGQFLRLSPDFVPTWMGATFATLTTTAASGITASGAVSGGNITSDGGSNVTERGICYNTSSYPTTLNTKVTTGFGTGSFTATLSQLVPNTTYYVRAYAVNSAGTAYGNEVSLTTLPGAAIPVITGVGSPCQNNSYTYSTQMYLPPYDWIVSGIAGVDYTKTAGGGPTDHTISITWHTPAAQTLSVSYFGASGYGALPVNVVETLPVSVVITASENPACAGTPVILTATPVNGGTTPFYQWQINGMAVAGGTNSSYTTYPSDWESISCTMSSSAPCAEPNPVLSNTVVMTVSDIYPAAVNIQASANPICTGYPVTFTATSVFGGNAPQFQWRVNGMNVNGATSSTYTYIPTNQDAVTCMMTSSLPCVPVNPVESEAIIMTVLTMSASVSIAASSNPSCQGQPVTFTATPTNAGTSPSYQWLINGISINGATNSTFSNVPYNGDSYMCNVTTGNSCASGSTVSSNVITMVVNPIAPVNVVITNTNDATCLGMPVTYSAAVTGGGANPVYQWTVNSAIMGGNNQTFTYVPANSDLVRCHVTPSVACPQSSPVLSNAITQTVLPIVSPNIQIVASANPVCTGTAVTFAISSISNQGTNPTYQWKKNGVLVSISPVLTYSPADNDKITCTLTSSLMCLNGNPITSNEITMTVTSALTVNATIAITGTNSNPFCQGLPVSFSSSVTNGGTTPVYQWLVNGVPPIPAATGSTYSYIPSDGDFVTMQVTSSLSCGTPNPVTSNGINLLRNNTMPASVNITASENPVCAGSLVTFMATPGNGGTNPFYRWYVSGVQKSAGNSASFTWAITGGEVIACTMQSNLACVSGSPATSNSIPMGTAAAPVPTVTISTLTNPFCPGTSVTFTSQVTNGGNTPAYQWKVNGSAVSGTTNATFTTSAPLANNDVVTCIMTSSATCINSVQAVSNEIAMNTSPSLPLNVIVSPSTNPACLGTAVQFTANVTNGGASPQFQWKKNSINITVATSSTYTYTPANSDVITCMVTSSLVCASPAQKTSDPVTMQVNTLLPVSLYISASANPVCLGSTVTMTANNIVNGGPSPVFKWRVNGVITQTSGSTNFTYIPQNGDVVTATLTSSLDCVSGNPAVSNAVLLHVSSPAPVSLTVTASDNPFCAGNQVTFMATPSNGGTNPTYQWYKNMILQPGESNPVYSYFPSDNDDVYCTVNSNQSCIASNPAQSNTVHMIAMATGMPVTASITVNHNPVCPGTQLLFTATITNGGSAPVYQWYKNNNPVGTNISTYGTTCTNNDQVYCKVTSNLSCASPAVANSNVITMTVLPALPASITISASSNPSCESTAVTYTAVAMNPGTMPTYRWKVNGIIMLSSGSPTFTYVPVNGQVIQCQLQSSQVCANPNIANSNNIVATVIPHTLPGITISPSANPVCSGSNVTYTASAVNGGSAPSYLWKLNGTFTGTNSPTYTFTPANNDKVACTLTSNADCVLPNTATSAEDTMWVSPTPPVSVNISASANPVVTGTIVTFTATCSNGGTTPLYQWKVNGVTVGGSTQSTFTYLPSNNDTVTCVLTSNALCVSGNPATSNPIVMSVTGGK